MYSLHFNMYIFEGFLEMGQNLMDLWVGEKSMS
jgi:hypothetical protein